MIRNIRYFNHIPYSIYYIKIDTNLAITSKNKIIYHILFISILIIRIINTKILYHIIETNSYNTKNIDLFIILKQTKYNKLI